jgi:hypothetical protein
MGHHVHEGFNPLGEDPISSWNHVRMSRHLREVHGMNVPMVWDLGRMHLAHLKDHQTGSAPEESAVPAASLPFQTCGAVSRRGNLVCQLEAGHPPVRAEYPADGAVFDHVDTRSGRYSYFNDENAEVSAVSTDTTEAKDSESRAIQLDRIICALIGTDFDRDWVADNGLGPSGRGALRRVYADPAMRLLTWLERGGIGYLSVGRTLADVSGELRSELTSLRAERDTAQKLQQAAESDRDRTAQDLASLREQLENALAGQRLLQGANARQAQAITELENQLGTDQREQGASLDAVQRELEQARDELIAAQQAGRILERQRDEAQADGALLGRATLRELLNEIMERIEAGRPMSGDR